MLGIQSIAFKRLVFSNTLTILFENEDGIDYPAIKRFLHESEDSVELCEQFRLHAGSGEISLRGHKLANGMYIISKESETYYSIKHGLDRKTVDQLLHYVVHIHETI
jgi:hypothetical protein